MALESPFEAMTPESIKAEMLNRLAADGVDIDTREGSYSNLLVSEAAYVMWKYGQTLNGLLQIIFPGTASGEYLDLHTTQIGMTRQPGRKATVTVTFSGVDGTAVPEKTAVCTESGLRFLTQAAVVITKGIGTVSAEAEETGAAYNVSVGSIDQLAVNLPGVTGVTNAGAGEGGTDPESDADLYARYHERMAAPIASGNANHYVMWAKEVAGVTHAACLPLWNGNGTVKVVLGGSDRGPVSSSVVAACQAHLEKQAPIGATVTAASVTAKMLQVAAKVTLESGCTAERVKTQLRQGLEALLETLPFGTAQRVPYSRFLACLLQCDGVLDYSACTVNGGTGAVVLAAGEVPAVGTVTVTTE